MRRYFSTGALAAAVLVSPLGSPAQQRPLPVIDVHLHAAAADSQGPPPLGLCPGAPRFQRATPPEEFPVPITGPQRKTAPRRQGANLRIKTGPSQNERAAFFSDRERTLKPVRLIGL